MNRLAITVMPLALAAASTAQTVLHQQHAYWPESQRLLNTSGYVRQTFGAETYFAIFKRDDCIGWGHNTDPGQQNSHRIDGVVLQYVDTDQSTPNPLTVSVFGEDPANPGFPAPTPIGGASGFASGVPGATGIGAFWLELPFPTPIYAPRSGDVFIGVELQAEAPGDAIFLATIFGDDPNCCGFTQWDLGNGRIPDTGHGMGSDGGFTFRRDQTSGQLFARNDALVLAPLSAQPSLGVGAQTVQGNLPFSNPALSLLNPIVPGFTTSPFSSFQPCLLTDKNGSSRRDNLVLVYENQNFTGVELVGLVLAPLGLSTFPIDLALIDPNWVGFFCLDQTISPQTIALGSTINGVFQAVVPIPENDRAGLLGLDFGWQMFGLDFISAQVSASPCARTVF